MTSIFRRLSIRRRSRRGRSRSCPPGIQATTSNADDVGTPQPAANPADQEHVAASSAPPPASTTVDVYEDRIDELGTLMAEQGRCLDEMASRSRRLSTENSMLRETVLQERLSKSAAAPTSPKRSPLKSISFNQTQKSEEQAKLVHKLKEENSLLHTQADLLATELSDANKLIAERDSSIATFGKELSSCVEKARSLMLEKSTWKAELTQKVKEVESLEASAKRSSALRSEATQRAEQYLLERKSLEAEVADLGTQMTRMSTKEQELHSQLVSKQGELEKLSEKLGKMEQAANSVMHEAKTNAETAFELQDSLRRVKAHNEQLELKHREATIHLAEGQISQHKLQTMNESLQEEVKAIVEKHKAQISGWSKAQKKLVATMEERYQEEMHHQQKQMDSLRRTITTVESDSAECKRALQSSEQRCSALEKLLASNDKEQTDSLNAMLWRATEAESRLETSQLMTKELTSKLSAQEEKCCVLQREAKDTESRHSKLIDGLKEKLHSIKEENEALASRIPYLEEETERTKQDCVKEKKKVEEAMQQQVREATVECEALRVATRDQKIKCQEAEGLLEKQTRLHQSTLETLTTEKNQLATKMERTMLNEREAVKRLMEKVQTLTNTMQTLTTEKLQLGHQANKQADQIYTLEKIIATGDSKLSQFSKQLARSMEDQERRIVREAELKRELNRVRIELDSVRRSGASD